ncbi:MAG: SWIM zinc finger family protein [Acidobacteria bacterium]|nr:SWIM zinc finger family protein [Acidobacteriota bacterium]
MQDRLTTIKLTDAIIRAGANEKSFARGQELYRSGAISDAAIQGNVLTGHCEGMQSPFYKVRAELDAGGVRVASCNCEYDFGGYCKHIVALLLTYAHEPKQFVVREDMAKRLATLSREQLMGLLMELLNDVPDLSDWLEAALPEPAASRPRKAAAPKRKKKINTEVYRSRVRGIMHSLDHMRMSEAYWHVGGLTDELRDVEKTAMEFLDAGDAETAFRVLMTLLEESHDGFEYIDDSNGELGGYLDGLGKTLAEVVLSLDLDEDQSEDILSDIDEIHSKLSNYGVDGLEVAIAAAQYGWGELPREAQEQRVEEDDEDKWRRPKSLSQILTNAKLNVLERQGRTDEYLALCLKSGEHLRYALKLVSLKRAPEAVKYALEHLAKADDALKLAQALRESRHHDKSLKIGERGLKLGGSKASLGEWLGPIEEAQGRTAQALEAWQAAFHDSPSLSTWKTIKRLAGSRWKRLKPELVASLEKGYNHQALAEVLIDEQEWDAAINVADKRTHDYRLVATVADALIEHRPEWVIRASVKQADGLIAKTQSKYYTHAANWLRRAKAAYSQLGRTPDWQKYLSKLKEQYKRRPALMAKLNGL